MVGYIIGGAFLALALVIFVRTLLFKPRRETRGEVEAVEVDGTAAALRLSEMIKCRTVSSTDKSEEDEREFEKFESLLPRLFPTLFSVAEYTRVSDRALLLRWRGKGEGNPTVLMAHYDVVSIVAENWEKPAFDGIIEDGVVWGRGAIDTKGTLNGALSAAEQLASEGFTPERDVYFAFAGDEEINGHGAQDIVAIFRERGITPELVLDEGGAVITGIFPGVKSPAAVIGIAEKGMVNIEYSVSGGGGHASNPKPHTPVGKLSAACVRVEKKPPFKYRVTAPTGAMFDTLGRHSTPLYRMIFANLWLFGPILALIGRLSGGQINAVGRTTVAFTQMQGSAGINVIPPVATMGSNSRILPGESVDSTFRALKKRVKDEKIEMRILSSHEPSRVSVVDCEGYTRVKKAAMDTWQEALVSPYLMTACSDARHWGEISDRVYRFSPMRLSKEENAMVHGNNERVPVSSVAETVEFYIRLIKQC